MDGLFDSEIEFEQEVIEGIKLKLKPRDSGQIESQVHLTVWPSAIELCKQSDRFIAQGANVLELGAGTGLLGIYISKNFDCDVLITDGNYDSVQLIRDNIELNQTKAQAEVLTWGEKGRESNIIVGSDIIYSKPMVLPLVQTIKSTLLHNGTCYLANHFNRFGSLQDLFYTTCSLYNLNVVNLPSILNDSINVLQLSHQ
jgi:Lysine methyltransferase